MICYCISGLGADHRIFERLDLTGVTLEHVPWLLPAPDEPLATYAGRMSTDIVGHRPIILGVSFGGMIAIEIAKYYPLATVILVSSLLNRDQRQLWMKIGRILHLERWLSQNYSPRNQGLRRLIAWVEDFYMGVENDWDGALVKSYRNRTDFRYLRWAIGQILHWDNRWIPTTVYQLHGGRDRIFRLPSAAVTHYIPDGGHLMIHNRPELVNPIIAGILEKQA